MIWRKFSLYLMLFLLISSATAARKTKRPVKPAKTYPRTNITPSNTSLGSGLSTVTTAGIAAGLTQSFSTSSSSLNSGSTTTMAMTPSILSLSPSSPPSLVAAVASSVTSDALASVATGNPITTGKAGQSINGNQQTLNQELNETGFSLKTAISESNALPKPMESSGNLADVMSVAAELKTDKPLTHGDTGETVIDSIMEEDCDPDMIGFEIITG